MGGQIGRLFDRELASTGGGIPPAYFSRTA